MKRRQRWLCAHAYMVLMLATATLAGVGCMGNVSGGASDASEMEASPADLFRRVRITTPAQLPSGIVGEPYTTTLTASGGRTPYRWAVTSGALPVGLHLDSAKGVISGTPTAAGSATAVITVVDARQSVARVSFTLAIDAAVASCGGDCLCAGQDVWESVALDSAQNGAFTLEFDAFAGLSATDDAVIGLSSGPASAYTSLAVIVRFAESGVIDAINGDGYEHATSIAYSAGTAYHFRINVDVGTHRADYYVSPAGGSEVLLGASYAFRSTQAAVASLDTLNLIDAASGDAATCSATVTSASPPEPSPVPPPPPPPTTPPTSGSCPYAAAALAAGVPDDGCAGAPAGTPQYPSLLDRYGANRPPWNVAGVDYYVGVPAGRALKDWRTLKTNPPAGLEWDSRGYMRCNAGNQVLDGYDFTTGDAGWSIYVPNGGCTGLSITNSKMGCVPGAGTGQNAPGFGGINSQSSNMALVFRNNTVDYTACQGSGGAGMGLITVGNYGCTNCSIDVQYNYVKNLYNTFLGYGGSYASIIHRYNVIENPATSAPGDPDGVHMNSFSGLATGTVTGLVYTFNTTFATQSFAGGEFPQFYYNGGGGMISPTVAYNTFPYSSCNCVSYKVHGTSSGWSPTTAVSGNALNTRNYFDTTDAYGPYYPGSFVGWNNSGNKSMNSGATITPP